MTAETFEIALKSNVAAVAAKDAAALDALLASGKKVNDGLLIGNLGKSETLAQIKAQSAELQQQAALSAKLAVFDADRIDEIERTTKHDVIAFLTHVAEIVGDEARFLHQGMTSSDVLDTCLAIRTMGSATRKLYAPPPAAPSPASSGFRS